MASSNFNLNSPFPSSLCSLKCNSAYVSEKKKKERKKEERKGKRGYRFFMCIGDAYRVEVLRPLIIKTKLTR